ncbi:MAG: SPOR domain-containing protein [Pseudomonadota bacterium]|nr:SPOR domain-containing protein [Pseudomonadota bacterium]
MAARRGKTQAKRNQGNGGGLPGWAWMVLGILLAVVVILVAPKYLKSGGDGFFRPQPNPDAKPAAVSSGDDEAIASDSGDAADKPKRGGETRKDTDFDFYTLLPGKEVPMSDAELAASEQAEAKREAARQKAGKADDADDADAGKDDSKTVAALPKPVETAPSAAASTAPASTGSTPAAATTTASADAPTAAATDDGTRYLLQAGAFQASGQAEEMKAKIALLGLSARVESASIKGSTVYRVRMGPYGTASDLADAKRKLASGGLPAMAIKVK